MTKASGIPLVRVLGPVDTLVDGQSVALSMLERGLLAALAARAGQVASVDYVIDTLWGEAPPGSARNRVHALVSSVRRAVAQHGGSELIVTRSPGYLLARRPETIDAVRFDISVSDARRMASAGQLAAAVDRYRDALQLWRGTPFDGAGALRTAEIQAELTRLEEGRLAAIEERIDAELALGQAGQLVGELTALVAALPFRERLRGQLMLALFRCGRQADAAATYRDGYRMLADELGSQPSAELQAIHAAILSGTVDAVAPDYGPRRPATVVMPEPRSICVPLHDSRPALVIGPDLPDFAGREAELNRIRATLSERSADAVLVCINGMGGVGKTALAIRATSNLYGPYPDGRLCLDMRGTDATPRTTAHAMASVLIATGTPASAVPDNKAALLTAYQAALSYHRLLIVLDNVADVDQVRSLLPPDSARSAVLTTSRCPLRGVGAALELTLDVLPIVDARRLLTALVGATRVAAEPIAADRLLEQCGRLPLAIRVVGARLANQSEHRLARVVERMAGLSIRLDAAGVDDRPVRAGLTVLYPRLSPHAARLLRLVSLLPTPELPSWVAAAAAGVPRKQADADLAALVGYALATEAFDAGGVRYRFHDLIRGFGRDLAATVDSDRDRDSALRRAYEALLFVANHAANSLPSASFPLPATDPRWHRAPVAVVGRTGPDGWFALEHELIFGAIHDCRRRGWLDLAWRLLVAITVDVGHRGAVNEWYAVTLDVLAALRAADADPAGIATLSMAAGGHLRGRQCVTESIRLLRTARLGFRRLGDPLGAAIAAGQLAMAHRHAAQFRAARAAFDWALGRIGADATAAHYFAQIRIGYGNLLLDLGEREGAAVHYDAALAALELRPNPAIEANALACLGNLAALDQRFDEAVKCYERARAELISTGDRTNFGWVELGLGHALLNLGDDGPATDAAARALASFRDVGDNFGYARALALEGRLLVRQGNANAAVIVLREAAAKLEPAGHHVIHRRVLLSLAEAFEAAGDLCAATQVRAQCEQMAADRPTVG